MGRNLIVGDIHSNYNKLMDVLSKAHYNPDKDVLYSVGDFCDRGKDAVKTIRFLMSQSNLKAVIGNHDIYLQNWLYSGIKDTNWTHYLGGNKTVQDITYRNKITSTEKLMIADWLNSIPLVRVEERYIIMHGGIPYRSTMKDLLNYQERKRQRCSFLSKEDQPAWDRDYMLSAYSEEYPEIKDEMFYKVDPFDTDKMIFVGHTPTLDGKPFISEKYHLVALDTGSGHNGPLTLMDMDTLEYWQS